PPSFFVHVPDHPPVSTLFPYTTLFRSVVGGINHERVIVLPGFLQQRDEPAESLVGARDRLIVFRQLGARRGRVRHPRRDDDVFRDRKSTRLNSSHVSISYAVFCLKKKT